MKLRYTLYSLLAGSLLILQSCDDKSRISSPELQDEMKSRKPVKISAGQITEGGLALGSDVSRQLEDAWLKRLDSAAATGEHFAILFQLCDIKSLPEYAGITGSGEVSVSRSALHPLNSANEAQDLSLELADAYQYNVENNLPVTNNLQKYNENLFLLTAPVIYSRTYCINCHGSSAQLAPGVEQRLKTEYNKDVSDSPSIEQQQLAGIWNVSFPRSLVVKRLSNKQR
jgi:hypothetical protein